MTDKQTPPDWALIEAANLFGWGRHQAIGYLRELYHDEDYLGYRALCGMIERYEQPPVDRKVLCAREAMARNDVIANADYYRSGGMDDGPAMHDCIRAIELWEEGYGQ